jgi:catechol 2,3-dioxygenase-like lactoylglutathione lyase family enzyme
MHSRVFAAAFLAAFTLTAAAQMPDKPIARPRITGISHIAIYTSNPEAADRFYSDVVGAVKQPDPENPKGVRYALSATQFIEVLPLPPDAGINRLDHTAWKTDDAEALRRYLGHKSWKVPGQVEKGADGGLWFDVKDPEGNKVQFVQPPAQVKPMVVTTAIGRHIIHVGYLVHSRTVENILYRDLLGFHPYWFGGMVEGRIDWVSQQSPDSHDWLEYMLTSDSSASGIPAGISQQQLGVLDHVSIGVISVDEAYKTLKTGNRLSGRHDDHPHIGRDGKGQLNLYDPDGTRIELMNFHATEKPCCSPFTADDPDE